MKCQAKNCSNKAVDKVMVHYREDFFLCDLHTLKYGDIHRKHTRIPFCVEKIETTAQKTKRPRSNRPTMTWISIKDQEPPKDEPIVYAKPDTHRGPERWHVGIAYWTVSNKWNPEAQSRHAPTGFTYWMPLPPPPNPAQ